MRLEGESFECQKSDNRLFIIFTLLLLLSPFQGNADNEKVLIVPIEETVEKGLYAFLSRAVKTAEEENASAIIFEINTPGGAVDAAGQIGRLLTSTNVKTISFVNKQALSAGAYIALNTDEIYMVPGSTMGSAAIIDQQGNTAGKKRNHTGLRQCRVQPHKRTEILFMLLPWQMNRWTCQNWDHQKESCLP